MISPKIKSYTLGAVIILLLSACSATEPLPQYESTGLFNVSLSFDITVNDATSTRSPRTLTSTDCVQDVNDVRIYVFRSESGNDDSSFLLYDAGSKLMKNDAEEVPHIYVDAFEPENNNGFDFNETQSLSLPMKLPKGYYRFLAIGRDDDSEQQSSRVLNWIPEQTSWTQAIMTNTAEEAVVTEFFSGYAHDPKGAVETLHIDQDGSFLSEITLFRAVAGIFLYVENIPEKVESLFDWGTDIKKGNRYEVTEVAIVGMGFDSSLNLVSRTKADEFHDFPDALLGLIRYASIQKTDLNKEIFNLKPDPAGSFIFPVALSSHSIPETSLTSEESGPCSLALCFYHGNYPLRLLPIRMARTTSMHPDEEIEVTDHNLYDIMANHLYCLGNLNKEDGTDNPVDLEEALRNHKLEITVVGAWQAIVDIEM
ncbi:MAG: hypothetical protein K2N05_06800 [Muribaculaceae bacterium]|nr:hypothetical protein [Muribaculaceae bacterium]